MFKVLILVCSMSTPSQDCGWDNAVDVIVGPSATNELTCGFSGQAYLAGTALAPTDGSYVKVQCTRTAIVDRAPRMLSAMPRRAQSARTVPLPMTC